LPAEPGLIADARLRVVLALGLAFGFSTLGSPGALAGMVGLTVGLVMLSGIGPAALARRLRLPGLMIAALVALLPFVSGETAVTRIGPLTLWAEGTQAALIIGLRFLCILSVIILFLASLPLPRLLAALRQLGLPALMVDMALLTLRHIEDLRADVDRMRIGMRLRGAGRGLWRGQFRATGWMLASLLLRSHARSERVYRAMLLRGHGAPGMALETGAPARSDLLWMAGLVGALVGLVLLDRVT